jgi:hypothetical protein
MKLKMRYMVTVFSESKGGGYLVFKIFFLAVFSNCFQFSLDCS